MPELHWLGLGNPWDTTLIRIMFKQYNDHPWDPLTVVVWQRWSDKMRFRLVVVDRWSLFRGGL